MKRYIKEHIKMLKNWLGLGVDKVEPPAGFNALMAQDLLSLCAQITSVEVANSPRLFMTIADPKLSVEVGIFKISDEHAAVVFNSTEAWNLRDWKTNSQFTLCKAGDRFSGNVHAGYSVAYRAVAKSIIKNLKKMAPRKVYCTGFSMGGPLAQQLALDIRNEGMVSACYTFGAPKTGDRGFAASHDLIVESWRVRLHNDVVPVLPPFGAYKQAGKPVRIHSGGFYMRKLDDLINFFCIFQPKAYKEHSIQRYTDAFKRLLN